VVRSGAGSRIAQALKLVERRKARLLIVRDGRRTGVVRREDLERAEALGLGSRPVADVAWWGVSTVSSAAPEVRVRRLLRAGARLVLVSEGDRPVAAVESALLPKGFPALALAGRLQRECPQEIVELLRSVGNLAGSVGGRAYLVGGFVRDLVRGIPSRDLDFVVEGDALGVARELCRRLRGNLVIHEAFGTASIEGWQGRRLDVAQARRERYVRPGALPTVRAAAIGDDLGRRDFTVNALAVALTGPAFGQLLDPFGGLADVARRKVRILHPLSFVEDPTRMFRAVRYAVRLGFAIDGWTRRCLGVALDLAPYPSLSGQRLLAEVELILGETSWATILSRLGRLGAFRLLDPAYRFSPSAAARLRDLGDLLRWGETRGVILEPGRLALLCLVGHLSAPAAERCLRRFALSGRPLARLLEAHAEAPRLARRLDAEARAPASQRARLLRAKSAETLGFAWLIGSPRERAQVEWFLAQGRGVRPFLGGEALLALGVPKGPGVSRLVERLRDARLDGLVSSREDEIRLVRDWKDAPIGSPSWIGKEE
jgi:tRNA nucleotidyltransferase (CCA-adding enzyme)